MVNQLLLVGIGGFLGAISRFLVSKYTASTLGVFPIGTLIVNVTGSFVLALISYLVLEGRNISPDVRNFATVGFIGAYTTMSTFSFETMRFLDQGEYNYFALNILFNIILCFGAIALARYCALLLTK